MKIDAEAIRAAQKALAAADEGIDDYDRWPKNRYGYPRIVVSNAMADRWIAAGAAVEDDLIRVTDLPLDANTPASSSSDPVQATRC